MARQSRLMLEVVVGPRTQESVMKLIEGAAKRFALNCRLLWAGDGWELYLFALTVVFAVLIHCIKGKGRGRPKEPQVLPDAPPAASQDTLIRQVDARASRRRE